MHSPATQRHPAIGVGQAAAQFRLQPVRAARRAGQRAGRRIRRCAQCARALVAEGRRDRARARRFARRRAAAARRGAGFGRHRAQALDAAGLRARAADGGGRDPRRALRVRARRRRRGADAGAARGADSMAARIQCSGMASAALCPCSRRAISATKALLMGGAERAMSATTRIRLFGSFCGDLRHLVGPDRPGRGPCVRDDAAADAAQVFDQCEAQHDRHGPQLAERQRADGLVGGDEAAEALRVHPPVAVRDGLQRDVVDTGEPGRGPVRQSGQLPAVTLGQVAPRGADLLFDQVEIVEQPFAGGRDPARSPGSPRSTARRPRAARLRSRRAARAAGRGRRRAPGRCAAASALPCCSIWSALNSSERSGGSSAGGTVIQSGRRNSASAWRRIRERILPLLFNRSVCCDRWTKKRPGTGSPLAGLCKSGVHQGGRARQGDGPEHLYTVSIPSVRTSVR